LMANLKYSILQGFDGCHFAKPKDAGGLTVIDELLMQRVNKQAY
jgi:hypothetical protein